MTPSATVPKFVKAAVTKPEVEELWHVGSLRASWLINHRITNHDDHAAGDVQTACDDFQESHSASPVLAGAYGDGNDNRRDSDTHCLQEQREETRTRCRQAAVVPPCPPRAGMPR